MKVIKCLAELPKTKKVVLTIGNFDGLHRGHLKIIRNVVRDARAIGGISVVLTFSRHPRKILNRHENFGLLYFLDQKLGALDQADVDACWLVDFNDVRNLTKENFLENFIVPQRIAKVVIGYDFHFGKQRSGTVESIRSYCREHRIRCSRVSAVKYKNEAISSNRIRKFIENGNFKDAKACLGKGYSTFGKVVHGTSVGKTIGVPTANIEVETETLPPDGVYRVFVRRIKKRTTHKYSKVESMASAKVYEGLAYKGKQPRFLKKSPGKNIVEVNIFDFEGSLYGAYLEIVFLEFVRKPKVVKSLEGLKKLIEKDIVKFT
ncbi:riboflavin biosynthesis protein RibF [Candidatus Omnitrophota bacterium]